MQVAVKLPAFFIYKHSRKALKPNSIPKTNMNTE